MLLIDAVDRVLLFRGFDPARPEHRYWFTVGGGVAAGESLAVGAARELREETGLALDPAELGEPIWSEVTEFPIDGIWYRQEQDFFVARVPSWEVCVDGFDAVERRSIDGFRWWTLAELEGTHERYYPAELPSLLRDAVRV